MSSNNCPLCNGSTDNAPRGILYCVSLECPIITFNPTITLINDQNIKCMFCNEAGFDNIGLKHHLLKYCEIFDNIGDI